MMIKKNEKGFYAFEFLSISTVCLFIATIILMIALQSSYTEKYKVMEYNAKTFGLSATTYQLEQGNNTIYLKELIDNDLFTNIKNPFFNPKYCDSTASKVEVKQDEKKYITLQCGGYLIYNQYIAADKYKIYKASPWSTKKISGDDIEEVYKYNYRKKGINVFNEYYEEKMFLYAFNELNNTKYTNISTIAKKYNVEKIKFYRSLKQINVVDNEK